MRTTRPVLASAIVIGALAAAPTSAAPRRADVEPLMARFVADSNVVGVSVGVEHGSDVNGSVKRPKTIGVSAWQSRYSSEFSQSSLAAVTPPTDRRSNLQPHRREDRSP